MTNIQVSDKDIETFKNAARMLSAVVSTMQSHADRKSGAGYKADVHEIHVVEEVVKELRTFINSKGVQQAQDDSDRAQLRPRGLRHTWPENEVNDWGIILKRAFRDGGENLITTD